MTSAHASRGGALLDALHDRLRWWTAPLQAVADLVPAGGHVADLGCGQGLVTALIAKHAREVVGVDFDERKCGMARDRLADVPNAHIVRGDILEWLKDAPAESLDAIVLSDTLSAMPLQAQSAVLAQAYRILRSHGTVVLKVVDTEPRWKAAIARTIAYLVCRVARVSLTQDDQRVYYRQRADYAGMMADAGLAVDVILLHRLRHSPIPHVAIVGHKT
jgi:ubiquinone/menaquinone biosynthesis C-methylase UbiE